MIVVRTVVMMVGLSCDVPPLLLPLMTLILSTLQLLVDYVLINIRVFVSNAKILHE